MASEEKAQKRSIAVPLVVIPMADAATAATNPSLYKNQSLIDELNAALATGGDDEQKRILERVADLFAAGARGYSSQQIALFDDVLQKLCADIEVKTRARLARRLAHIDNAPPRLIARSPRRRDRGR
jgi:uncharacterized protein (DUF2336 family)